MSKETWTDDLLTQVARAPTPPLPEGFMAQLLAEAQSIQAAQHPPLALPSKRRASWRDWLLPLSGLTAAMACGLGIGFTLPDLIAPSSLALEPYHILDVYALLEETP